MIMKVKELITELQKCDPEAILSLPVINVEQSFNGYDGYASSLKPHRKYKGKSIFEIPEEDFNDYLQTASYVTDYSSDTQVYIETLLPREFVSGYDPKLKRTKLYNSYSKKHTLLAAIEDYADGFGSNIPNSKLVEHLKPYTEQDSFLKEHFKEIIEKIKQKRKYMADLIDEE